MFSYLCHFAVMKTLCKKGAVYQLTTYAEHKNRYHWTPSKSHPHQGHTPDSSHNTTPLSNHGGQGHYHDNSGFQGHHSGHNEGHGHSEEGKKGFKRSHSAATEASSEEGTISAKKSKKLNVE